MMADDKSKLVKPAGEDTQIYYDQTPRSRLLQVLFVAFVIIMVLITIVLSIYRGIKLGDYGSCYFMLGISLVGFVVLEILLIHFIRKEDLPKDKSWFLYFVGGCIIAEALFTDILVFQ